MSEIYEIIYFQDEVSINPTNCKQPGFCSCEKETNGVKCGYSAEEAQRKLIDYYRHKARWLEELSPNQFLQSMGIYTED